MYCFITWSWNEHFNLFKSKIAFWRIEKNHINDFLGKNQDLPKSEKTQTLDISIGIFACERTSFCL